VRALWVPCHILVDVRAVETTLGRCVALSQLAAERFQAIENVPKNGSFGDKILPSKVNQNGSLVQLSDSAAVGDAGQRVCVTKRYRLLLLLR
jgi:hypothetical protein